MIFSPSKAEDMKWRASLLKQMQKDLKDGFVRTAKAGGQLAHILGEKIKNKDYTEDDARYARLAEMDKRRKEIRNGNEQLFRELEESLTRKKVEVNV